MKVYFNGYMIVHILFNVDSIYISPTIYQFSHPINEEFRQSFLDHNLKESIMEGRQCSQSCNKTHIICRIH